MDNIHRGRMEGIERVILHTSLLVSSKILGKHCIIGGLHSGRNGFIAGSSLLPPKVRLLWVFEIVVYLYC